MVSFKIRNLTDNSTLGEKLKKLRQEKNFDLSKMAKLSGVCQKYLIVLEEDNYQKLPSYFYAQNYLKSYLFALNIDQKESEGLFKLLESEYNLYQKRDFSPYPKNFIFDLKKYLNKIEVTPQKIRLTLGIILVFVCFSYIGLEIKKIISPPFLIIESPEDNLITNKQIIEVKGRTEKEVKLTINEQEIFVAADGGFFDKIFLQEGLNVIKISAKKKYSQDHTIFKKVLVVGSDEKKQEVSINN